MRLLVLAVAATGAAHVRPLTTRAAVRGAVRCQAEPPKRVPVPFAPLSKQEIVHKLDAVPVFSVVNARQEMVASAGPDGELNGCFYLDLTEAKADLQALQTANPRARLTLATTPLGTAFALSEWQSMPAASRFDKPGSGERMIRDASRRARQPRPAGAGASPDDPDDIREALTDEAERMTEAASSAAKVRLRPIQAELAAVAEMLEAESPCPPLLRRRNRISGAVPLYGSDELRITRPASESEQLQAEGAAVNEVETLLPLFLRRADARAAWLASGGAEADLPPLQLTDLRTLAWQMQTEGAQDWRPIVLVAPSDSIAHVEEEQRASIAAAALEAAAEPKEGTARSQGLAEIFPIEKKMFPDA